jgi:hypothetical protein
LFPAKLFIIHPLEIVGEDIEVGILALKDAGAAGEEC